MQEATNEAVIKLMIGINIGLAGTLVSVLWWVYRSKLKNLLRSHSQDISTHRRFLLSHAMFLANLKKEHGKFHPDSDPNGLLDPNELLELHRD